MLISECLECGERYNKVNNGMGKMISHGLCPACFLKIRDFRRGERERARIEEIARRKK